MKLSDRVEQNWAAKLEGTSVAGWWEIGLAVQDGNQAAGHKMKQDWENSSSGPQRNWAVGLVKLGSRAEGKGAVALEGI